MIRSRSGGAAVSVADHLPMLEALGVKRVNGRVGGLMALRSLTFAELSAELTASGAEFPCGAPHQPQPLSAIAAPPPHARATHVGTLGCSPIDPSPRDRSVIAP